MSEINNKNKVRKKPTSLITSKKDKSKKYYGESETREALIKEGDKIKNDMTKEELSRLNSKSGTLHFINLLGLGSKKSQRSVGITLKSDISITIPQIDMKIVNELMRRKKSGEPETLFDVKNDIRQYIEVKVGEEFHLSLYEFMFLILRPEYAGLFEANGDSLGAELRVKTPNAVVIKEDGTVDLISDVDEEGNKKFKLPTPTIQFYAKGIAPKAGMIDIDQMGPNGWEIKPEYVRFKELVIKNGMVRGDKKKAKVEAKQKLEFEKVANIKIVESKEEPKSSNLADETICLAIALQEALSSSQRPTAKEELELILRGQKIISLMGVKQKQFLGSKSGTLHFVRELMCKYRNDFYLGSNGRLEGVTLKSDAEIQVPTIPINKDRKKGIDPSTDIKYRSVTAGEEFDLTLDEFMYLILRDEYAGYCEAFGDPKGTYFSPNLKGYLKGEYKLPVPRFQFVSALNNIRSISISVMQANVLKIKPEYQEKFGALL